MADPSFVWTRTIETFEGSPTRSTGIFKTETCPFSFGSFTLNLASPNIIIGSGKISKRHLCETAFYQEKEMCRVIKLSKKTILKDAARLKSRVGNWLITWDRLEDSVLTVSIIFYLEECFILSSYWCPKWRFTLRASQHEAQFFVFFMFGVIDKCKRARLFSLSWKRR